MPAFRWGEDSVEAETETSASSSDTETATETSESPPSPYRWTEDAESSSEESDAIEYSEVSEECALDATLPHAEYVESVGSVQLKLGEFKRAMEAVRKVSRVNQLGFEEVKLLQQQALHSQSVEEEVAAAKLSAVQSILATRNMVAADAYEVETLRALRRLKDEKDKELLQLLKERVDEEVRERVRQLDVRHETEFTVEVAKEERRALERHYLEKQAEHLKEDLASTKKLLLRITRARCGDTSLDAEEQQIADARRAARAAADAELERKLAQVKQRLADAQAALRQAMAFNFSPAPRSEIAEALEEEAQAEAGPAAKRGRAADGQAVPQPGTGAQGGKVAREKRTRELFGLNAEVGAELWKYLKDPEWRAALEPEARQPYFTRMSEWLTSEYQTKQICPALPNVFRCFNETPLSKVRVVLIGQDPYPDRKLANGLAFSVPSGTRPPPSLKNIFAEVKANFKGTATLRDGDLAPWAAQGVLLLNSSLTVEAGKPGSHRQCGWQNFVDYTVKVLSEGSKPLVFLLFGSAAKRQSFWINRRKHKVIECAHPSPLSSQLFKGSRVFARCNDALAKMAGGAPIVWAEPNKPKQSKPASQAKQADNTAGRGPPGGKTPAMKTPKTAKAQPAANLSAPNPGLKATTQKKQPATKAVPQKKQPATKAKKTSPKKQPVKKASPKKKQPVKKALPKKQPVKKASPKKKSAKK